MKIPLHKPYLDNKIIRSVIKTIKSRKLARGNEVEKFEKDFAEFVGKKYAIALNSGTSGLHVAVRAMGWKKGDEVITTPFSFIASSNALLYEDVTPIFVDIDPQTLNIDVNKIEEKITKKTKGIILVHILGLPVENDKIEYLKKKYNLKVIEDSCEAIGGKTTNFYVSNVGELSVYGFHENKQMTTLGEGGMIVTDNDKLAEICRSMRDQGRSNKKDWLNNVILGYNFRMTEAQATYGICHLKKMDKILLKREKIASEYGNMLANLGSLTTPQKLCNRKRSWFLYYILLEDTSLRDKVYEKLLKNGVSSSKNYFPPIYNFPMYDKSNKGKYKITEDISSRLLALPMFYDMSKKQIKYISDLIKNVVS